MIVLLYTKHYSGFTTATDLSLLPVYRVTNPLLSREPLGAVVVLVINA